jgi:cytochrome c5
MSSAKWLSVNSEGDQFDWLEPYYLKVDHERELIYVVARIRNWIGVINFEGEKQYTFGNGVLNYPHEIDIGPDGKIYIADSKNYRLVVYDSPDSNDYEIIQFTPNFGYMKTVSIDYDGSLALGFNDGEIAYVLLLSTKKNAQKKPGKEIIDAQKKVIEKNKSVDKAIIDETLMMRTDRLYTQNCAGCHENGSFGAPTRGDLESWAKFPTDRKILLSLAFSGNGAMMPKGGCNECTAEDLRELIKYITPMDWLTGKD